MLFEFMMVDLVSSTAYPKIQVPAGLPVGHGDGVPSHVSGQDRPTSVPASQLGHLGIPFPTYRDGVRQHYVSMEKSE